MVDGAFCGNCGVAVAADDRFCGECGASQEAYATTSEGDESFSVQGMTGGDGPALGVKPAPHDGGAKSSSRGFWEAAGIATELVARGVYVVVCAAIAVLAFQNEEPLIGAGAIAYGLYILAGGRWFVY